MELYPHMYVGSKVKHPDKLLHKLKARRKFLMFYVIVLSKNYSDQLEIYKACYLSQKFYQTNPFTIIGLASDYDEALEIVTQIVKDCYDNTGDCVIKDFLKDE